MHTRELLIVKCLASSCKSIPTNTLRVWMNIISYNIKLHGKLTQILNNKSTSRICLFVSLSLSLLMLFRGMSLCKLFLHIKNIDFVNQAVLNIKKKELTGLCHIESLYFVPSNRTYSHRNWSFLGCQVQRVALNFFSHLYSFGNTKTSYFSKYYV